MHNKQAKRDRRKRSLCSAGVLECFTALNAVNVNNLVTYIMCCIFIEFEKFKSATNVDHCHMTMHKR